MPVIDRAEMYVSVLVIRGCIEDDTVVAFGEIMPAAVAEDIVHCRDSRQRGIAPNHVNGVLDVDVRRVGVGTQGLVALTNVKRPAKYVGIALLSQAEDSRNEKSCKKD